jgi:hypothetical protein
MKLVVDAYYRNSRGQRFIDDTSVITFPEVKIDDTPDPVEDVDDLDKTKPIKFGRHWATLGTPRAFDLLEDREIFEWFCCGYLQYYDLYAPGGPHNHGIRFRWLNSNRVKIYLFPSAKEAGLTIDPQRPPMPPPPPQFT